MPNVLIDKDDLSDEESGDDCGEVFAINGENNHCSLRKSNRFSIWLNKKFSGHLLGKG